MSYLTPKYIWQPRYEAALLATDPLVLQEHITRARLAMRKRLLVLKPRATVAAMDEYEAIQDAEAMLRVLEKRNMTIHDATDLLSEQKPNTSLS